MLETIKKSPVKIGIILALLIILNVVGWYLYLNWDTPFGDPLDLPTATQEIVQEIATETPSGDGTEDTEQQLNRFVVMIYRRRYSYRE